MNNLPTDNYKVSVSVISLLRFVPAETTVLGGLGVRFVLESQVVLEHPVV